MCDVRVLDAVGGVPNTVDKVVAPKAEMNLAEAIAQGNYYVLDDDGETD